MSLNNVRRAVIQHKLQELFVTKGFFDICILKDLLKFVDMELNETDNTMLRMFHCVRWEEMGPGGELEFKQHLIDVLRRYLGNNVHADADLVTEPRLLQR